MRQRVVLKPLFLFAALFFQSLGVELLRRQGAAYGMFDTHHPLDHLAVRTLVFLEFYWDGSGIEVLVNGSSVETPAVTNLPNDVALRLSLELLTGEAVAQTMNVRQLRAIQIGR